MSGPGVWGGVGFFGWFLIGFFQGFSEVFLGFSGGFF